MTPPDKKDRPPGDDQMVQNLERNVLALKNRGFIFTDQGRLVTMDDLKLEHEQQEGDKESIKKNF